MKLGEKMEEVKCPKCGFKARNTGIGNSRPSASKTKNSATKWIYECENEKCKEHFRLND